MTDELAVRLDAIERQMATLNRRFGEPRRRPLAFVEECARGPNRHQIDKFAA